jgi:hypothetical protein
MGLIEPVISLQNELNTVRRQRLDNVNLMINRMWKVLSTADVDMDKLTAQPGGIVLTDNMEAIDVSAGAGYRAVKRTRTLKNRAGYVQRDDSPHVDRQHRRHEGHGEGQRRTRRCARGRGAGAREVCDRRQERRRGRR